jgi:fatty-acyl-CoA synthase
MGEEVGIWIKLKEEGKTSVDDFLHHFKGRIAHFKIPRYFRMVHEFPMTVTGKIKKNDMRHITNELLKKTTHDIVDIK